MKRTQRTPSFRFAFRIIPITNGQFDCTFRTLKPLNSVPHTYKMLQYFLISKKNLLDFTIKIDSETDL